MGEKISENLDDYVCTLIYLKAEGVLLIRIYDITILAIYPDDGSNPVRDINTHGGREKENMHTPRRVARKSTYAETNGIISRRMGNQAAKSSGNEENRMGKSVALFWKKRSMGRQRQARHRENNEKAISRRACKNAHQLRASTKGRWRAEGKKEKTHGKNRTALRLIFYRHWKDIGSVAQAYQA